VRELLFQLGAVGERNPASSYTQKVLPQTAAEMFMSLILKVMATILYVVIVSRNSIWMETSLPSGEDMAQKMDYS